MSFRIGIYLLIFNFFSVLAPAQESSSNLALLLGLDYGYQIPGGDLAKRFGPSFELGVNLNLMNLGKGYGLGIEGGFFFGNQVKEDVLKNLRTSDGGIIANDKTFADAALRQRGWMAGLAVSKLFPLSAENKGATLMIQLGSGILEHKIRIQDDPSKNVPILREAYKSGFDRLSNGWYTKQFIGFQSLASDRRINYYVGFEFVQAYTQGRRDFDFATQATLDEKRIDTLWGLKVGWILPFYFGDGREFFY